MTARDAVARSIARFEGGESNHPDDRGGWTRFGLTYREFARLRPGKGEADFRALTRDDVIDIITEEWALKPGYWRIVDQWVMWAVIDFAIHSGPLAATRALQRAADVEPDGLFGRQTEWAVNGTNPERLFRRLMAERIDYLVMLVVRDASQRSFLRGWMTRATALLREAA